MERVLKLLGTRKVLIALYLLTFASVHSILYKKIGAFGCFDDCSNYMAGWFLLKGRVLYEQIFFNHQPLAAYLSALIQGATHPQSIYQLILYHRLVVYIFSFFFGVFLIFRFGRTGLLFLLLYEPTKYYFFGDRFLAEALISYPFVYVLGVVVTSLQKEKLRLSDIFLATLSVWFIIWMREPYVPAALFLYGVFLIVLGSWRLRIISLALLGIGSVGFFALFPFSDYFYSVVTINQQFHLQQEGAKFSLLQSFFYPIVIFLQGKQAPLHLFEMFLSIIFLALLTLRTAAKQSVSALVVIFLTLGVVNLRVEAPGIQFYEAFHMLNWYALFLMSISLLLSQIRFSRNYMRPSIAAVCFLGVFIFLLQPSSYVKEKTDAMFLFFQGYNQYYSTGELVKRLSSPNQSLFLDGWNDLIYWQAERVSPYQYSWYTSIMPGFNRYKYARTKLLSTSPPDFFYGACKEWPFSKVSDAFISMYKNISYNGVPTCLYIKESVVAHLSKEQLTYMQSQKYTFDQNQRRPKTTRGISSQSSL